jgi:hypothetical protein
MEYKSVTLPAPLVLYIKKFIEEHPEEAYSGVVEFIKVAVREKIEKEKEHME